jgi:hypothetical protein
MKMKICEMILPLASRAMAESPVLTVANCSRWIANLGCALYGAGIPSGVIAIAMAGAAARWERFAHHERRAKKIERRGRRW